jgi:catalase
MVGLVVDPDGDLGALPSIRQALLSAGATPLVIAPRGGTLPDGTAVQRTLLTGRSVELDALVLLGSPAPDPRLDLMIDEAFRHAKTIAATGAGRTLLEDTPYAAAPGVLLVDEPAEVPERLLEHLAGHRVWDRFPVSGRADR